VSAWTELSRGALAQLRYLGKGPRFRRLTAKAIRYSEKDVQAWLDESARTAAGAA
jgi:predicted DNA-binding transcriptional regulator AlpA